MRETVAIVGSHPRTREYAPFDQDIDVWVFNEVMGLGHIPRADAVFQMHRPPIWKNPTNRNDANHYAWLQQEHPFPVYMLEQYAEVPAAAAYPLEALCDALLGGQFDRRYFTSSVAYAVALAIYQGYRRIELYGVEMETNTEYYAQRDGVYFWVGLAIGRGVSVYIHPESSLFKSPLYGYEGDIELKRQDFVERLAYLEGLVQGARSDSENARKAQTQALERAVRAKGPEREGEVKRFFATIKAQTQTAVDLGALEGAMAENQRYIAKADAMHEAAGGVLFSRQEFEQTAAKAQEEQERYEALMHNIGGQTTLKWRAVEGSVNEPMGVRERLAREYIDGHNQYLQAAYSFGRCLGAVRENIEFLQRVDELVRMAGGSKSEEVLIAARKEGAYA